MNLEELQAARDRERQTDKLQQLRESFYSDAGEFIQQLRSERDRAAERADDPFDSPEVNQLSDEIDTAEQTVEAIYEKRVGKIVKAASFAAADLPAEADGMTAEEQELFETLVGNIKQNRQHVLDILAGEADESAEPAPEANPAEPDVSAADLMGTADGGSPAAGEERTGTAEPEQAPPEPADREHPPAPPQQSEATNADPSTGGEPASHQTPDGAAADGATNTAPGERAEPTSTGETGHAEPETTEHAAGQPTHQGDAVRNDGGQPASTQPAESDMGAGSIEEPSEPAIERETVRITDDIETFVGSDERDYDLKQDDVVTLPESNASLLIERDAAEEL